MGHPDEVPDSAKLQFVGVEEESTVPIPEAGEPESEEEPEAESGYYDYWYEEDRHHHGRGQRHHRGPSLVFNFACAVIVLLFVRAEIRRRDARREARGELPLAQQFTGQWRHGLFSCFGHPGLCLKSCFCFRLMEGLNTAELDGRPMSVFDGLFGGCNPALSWFNRRKIQHARNIEPEPVGDCLKVVCCGPCATAQHTLEIEEGLAEAPTAVVVQGAPASAYPGTYAASQAPVVVAKVVA